MQSLPQFEEKNNALLVRAPAKLNLTLLIAGKRPDGFHELESLMVKIDLYDELLIENSQSGQFELECRGQYKVSGDQDNLVYRASQRLYEEVGRVEPVKVTVTKNIPIGAGLGGGSSDAAAALIGLNRYLRFKLNCETLHNIAAELGSDVPFFLGSQASFCTGRGEKMQKITKKFDFQAILVFPDVMSYTKRVYENYRHNESLYNRLSSQIKDLIGKNCIDLPDRICANMLETSCLELYPEIADIRERLRQVGIGHFRVSGSGSSMFCILSKSGIENKRYQPMAEQAAGCKCILVNSNRW